MTTLSLILLFSMANMSGIPELDENTQIRLSAAVDGPDSRGEAFAALVSDAANWDKPINPECMEVDYAELLENPSQSRGKLIQIDGILEQQQEVGLPWDGVQEWFIRSKQGSVYCVYVVGAAKYQNGSMASMPARFYKTMSMEGRDKQVRMYPTFVTSSLAITTEASFTNPQYLFVLLPLVVIAAIVVFILGRIGKRRQQRRPRIPIETDDVLEAVGNSASGLSDNPSQALAEMYEQSEGDV